MSDINILLDRYMIDYCQIDKIMIVRYIDYYQIDRLLLER